MARLALVYILAVAACSSSPVSNSDGAADALSVEGRYYHQGSWLCCAPGEGVCCNRDAGETCMRHGGIYGRCLENGELIEGKVTCGHCCPGLYKGPPDMEATPSILMCQPIRDAAAE